MGENEGEGDREERKHLYLYETDNKHPQITSHQLFTLLAKFFLNLDRRNLSSAHNAFHFNNFLKFQLKTMLLNDVTISINCLTDRINK